MSNNRSGSRTNLSSPSSSAKAASSAIDTSTHEEQSDAKRTDHIASKRGGAVAYEAVAEPSATMSLESMVESAVGRWIVDEMILDELINVHWSYKAGLISSEPRDAETSSNSRSDTNKSGVGPIASQGTASEVKSSAVSSGNGSGATNGSIKSQSAGNASGGVVLSTAAHLPTVSSGSSATSPIKPPGPPQPTSSATTICPSCGELVGSQRFAYHLFKCMVGGGRKAAKPRRAAASGFTSVTSNADDSSKATSQQNGGAANGATGTDSNNVNNKSGSAKRSAAMMKDLEYFQDKPIIVKIKLNEKGLPVAKQSREIASYQEFLSVVNSQNR